VTDNGELSNFDSWRKRRKRLKFIGAIVLVLGLSSAGFVYWRGIRATGVADDLSMVGYSRAQTRQMESLYGKMGPMIDDWVGVCERPGTQAVIIASVSIVIATGCFLFDRHLYDGVKPIAGEIESKGE
jgi:hypothetical protein